MDQIYGVTMEMLTELITKHGELRAQYGEQQGHQAFQQYLAGRGLDENVFAHAHNGWMERFRADPTGRSEAQFHLLLQQASRKAHMADVRDMSQDVEEGITLDQYAQITVAVSRAGASAEDVVRHFGLADIAHWQRANAAWTARMGADTSHKLSTQFGTLYQTYAGPSFQEETVDRLAADLAAANARPRTREPVKDLTAEECLEKMQSTDLAERWKYAGLYANMVDLGNVPDKAAGTAHVAPILLEMIEQHDERSTSSAELGIRRLWDLGVRTEDVHGAVARCLNRAREKLVSLQAAFAPIQNQAVPERIPLQARIQDYESLIGTMEQYLAEDWSPARPPVPAYAAPSGAAIGSGFNAPFPAGAYPVAARRAGGASFPKWIAAPVVLVVLGVVSFFRMHGGAPATTATTAATVPTADTANPMPPAVMAAPPATGAAPAASSAAKGAKAKHGK